MSHRDSASLKPGKPYTQKRIDAAAKLMKRELANQHHLASKITLDNSQYHQDTNHGDLVLNTRPGPIVKYALRAPTYPRSLFFVRDRSEH